MTKIKKIALILTLVLALTAVLVACQSYEWGPVMGKDSDAEVVNNGSLAVRQGKYIYYVNGMDSTSNITKPEDNYFGKAPVKGNIMKSEIAEDGSLKNTEIVVPKMVYTGYKSGGIYIYGDWIYYTTPTTKTDNTGVVQVDYLEYMRTKTDGTETQQITMVEGATVEYTFTENALLYYASNTLYKVGYTADKVDKEATVIAEEVTDVLFNHSASYVKGTQYLSSYVYYTKNHESDSLLSGNLVYATNGGEPVVLINENTYGESTGGSFEEQYKQFTIGLIGVANEADGTVVYYTKSVTKGGTASAQGTYAYKFTGTAPSFNKDGEVKVANDTLTAVTHIGLENGVLDASSTNAKIIKMEGDIQKNTKITFSATPTIVSVDDMVITYVVSNKLMRMDLKEEAFVETNMSTASINTSWFAPSIVDGKLYYIDSTYSYTFVMNLADFSFEPNNVKILEGKMASGYIESDKTKDGLIPKFMTDADKETYIKNNPKEEK